MGLVHNSFSLMLIVSGTLHLGLVAWGGLSGDTPPRPIQPLRGHVSIELSASVSASPQDAPRDQAQDTPKPVPDALLQPMKSPLTEVMAALPISPDVKLPPPQTVLTLPRPELPPLPKIKPAEEPKPRPDNKPRPPGPVESASSPGSKASEGSEGDEMPQKIPTNPLPPWPADAWDNRWEGLVLLRVMVDAEGYVQSARLYESSGVPSLDDSALTTVYRWRFHPARRRGVAVSMEVNVPIRFYFRNTR